MGKESNNTCCNNYFLNHARQLILKWINAYSDDRGILIDNNNKNSIGRQNFF